MIQQAIDHLKATPISHPFYRSRIDMAVKMETQMLIGAVEFDGALMQLAEMILEAADLLDLKATQEAVLDTRPI